MSGSSGAHPNRCAPANDQSKSLTGCLLQIPHGGLLLGEDGSVHSDPIIGLSVPPLPCFCPVFVACCTCYCGSRLLCGSWNCILNDKPDIIEDFKNGMDLKYTDIQNIPGESNRLEVGIHEQLECRCSYKKHRSNAGTSVLTSPGKSYFGYYYLDNQPEAIPKLFVIWDDPMTKDSGHAPPPLQRVSRFSCVVIFGLACRNKQALGHFDGHSKKCCEYDRSQPAHHGGGG